MKEIDTTYSITERRYLAYHARGDTYSGNSLPMMCKRDSLLATFFISERLLAGYKSEFEDSLHDVIAHYRLRDLPENHALTFAEILTSNGCYEEAFFFLLNTEWAFLDVDALLILTEAFLHADEAS